MIKFFVHFLIVQVVMASHNILRSEKVTNYGDAETAKFHARIQECGKCDGVSKIITSIVEGCDLRYHGWFYFTVGKDVVETGVCRTSTGIITKGNFDMSIENMDGSGEILWVHNIRNRIDDWESFYSRLCKAIQKINSGSETRCGTFEESAANLVLSWILSLVVLLISS